MRATTVCTDLPVDPVRVGAATGMLWSSGAFALAGVGEAARIRLGRSGEEARRAQDALAELGAPETDTAPTGAVAFVAMPFALDREAELIVPEVVVGTDGISSWITAVADGDVALDEVGARVSAAAAVGPGAAEPTSVTISSAIPPEEWRDEILAPVRDRIRAGELTKAVLARELLLRADQPIRISAVLERLVATHPAAMVFAVEGFIGASPELLVARDGDTVRAHPLAGTLPRASDPEVDAAAAAQLLTSTKDRWEHRITIDWLLDELLPFCSYVDAEPEPTIVSLPNVHHLGTRVEGRLSRPAASVLELVAALHPTPAVGGAPQQEALALIAAVERLDRGRYAGPVGWVDAAGNGAFAVGIRSAEIDGVRARIMAGVGVVADSEPASELAETRAKFQAMLPALLRL